MLGICVSPLGGRSSSPSQAFRWLKPQLKSSMQPQQRPWARFPIYRDWGNKYEYVLNFFNLGEICYTAIMINTLRFFLFFLHLIPERRKKKESKWQWLWEKRHYNILLMDQRLQRRVNLTQTWKSSFHHWLALWLWSSPFIHLNLSFHLSCKMRIIKPNEQNYCGIVFNEIQFLEHLSS